MVFSSRKFKVWLTTIGVVFVVYLFYSQMNETPQTDIGTGTESADVAKKFTDSNEIGMVGDIGVGTVEVAEFVTLNQDKEIDRKWGFKKLLHKEGSQWELEEPYMDIFRNSFKCRITADRGNVQMETAVGKPTPKDAALVGNVVIHIVPKGSGSVQETFIYLDDIIFISERSQFSTAGPVKLVSDNVQMFGRGLEIVYNDNLDRLELLRIIKLEVLRVRQSPPKTSLLPSTETKTDSDTAVVSGLQPDKPAEPAAVKVYSCMFSKNVVVDAPEQLVAADAIVINNIIFSDKPKQESEKTVAVSNAGTKTDDVPALASNEPNKLPEQLVDIVITCDDGIYVVPRESPRVKTSLGTDAETIIEKAADFNDTKARTTFFAQRIDYDYDEPVGNVTASGWSQLTFHPNDVMGSGGTTVPVKISAHKEAKFLPALNQVIFEGDSLCTMLREEENIKQKYTLSSPKLTVDLSRDRSKGSSGSVPAIKHVNAGGGVVKLATVKTAEELLGGIELKCLKFDFDTNDRTFVATGPGIIKVDNSRIPETKRRVGKFGLRKQCYALVDGFDTLTYFIDSDYVIANSETQGIHIGYIPVVKGKEEQVVKATASHVEARLIKAPTGQSELSTLSATGGITYEEELYQKKNQRKTIQFVGSGFCYDANENMIYAWGSGSQPCFLNGALVDGIKYNLKSGRIKAEIVGPGMLQMGR